MDSDAQISYPNQFWHHDEKRKYDVNSKIMLTAIISLSVVVLLVSALHIYARCVFRRQARRRAALRQLRIIATAHYQSAEPPSRGLDPSIIASLPKFNFIRLGRKGDAKELETGAQIIECSVCLSSLENGEIARKLPNCGHIFHAECIDKWFTSRSTCPVCRTEAEPQPGFSAVNPEPREGAVGVPVPVSVGPTAPPLERGGSLEGTSINGGSAPMNGSSSSRLSSFRSILSWDRSSKRIQNIGLGQEACSEDLERQ